MSNSIDLSDRSTTDLSTVCRPARPGEVRTALRLILSNKGRLASEEQVVDFLRFSVQRRMNLNDLWIAERDGHMAWAALPVVSPGKTMLLFSPNHPIHETQHQPARELIAAICNHWTSRGLHLAQALLDPADMSSQRLYSVCHFQTLAELVYLQAPGTRWNGHPAGITELYWREYSPASHDLFSWTILQSYDDSLDCPTLNGQRNMEDVIAGHKAAGEFDPRLWLLLCDHSRPLGVLLLAQSKQSEVLELVYLGLTRQARGRGLGDMMMARALHTVRKNNFQCLSLAVDSRNTPALKLYYRHGMKRICSKMALLRDLRLPPPPNPRSTAGGPSRSEHKQEKP